MGIITINRDVLVGFLVDRFAASMLVFPSRQDINQPASVARPD
jgi:hypothetical protein